MFKNIFFITLGLVLGLTIVTAGNAQEGPSAQMMAKPVICAPVDGGQSMEMLSQIKKDGMKPLLYFRGNSFLDDGRKFNADFFMMYNAKEEIMAFIERQDNGFTCLIAGGTGDVVFDPETLESLIGWNDIP